MQPNILIKYISLIFIKDIFNEYEIKQWLKKYWTENKIFKQTFRGKNSLIYIQQRCWRNVDAIKSSQEIYKIYIY